MPADTPAGTDTKIHNDPLVAAVVVTHNRRNLLLESLTAVHAQTRVPTEVIVVDNACTDGTAAAVRARFPAVHLARLERNYGGAGGFAYGMGLALARAADLIWLLDDDTVPEPGALQALLEARARYPGRAPALVASRVLWTDGRAHPMNTARARPFAARAQREAAAAAGCVPVRSASFVSILVDAARCRQAGLPQADFFLWNDDFEFTARLLRSDTGVLCRASVVVHKTRTFGSTDVDPGDRFFYEVRNKVWTFRARSLRPAESVLYAGATLRRWARTFARSPEPAALGSALVRGLAAGIRTTPRPNAQVLPDFAHVLADVTPGHAPPRPGGPPESADVTPGHAPPRSGAAPANADAPGAGPARR
jgi:rhamnopyranosyl-N-acetylglucosaminyl-diphospho-decaprenol beta-1,3/1,4-galactofuranosyltransferase